MNTLVICRKRGWKRRSRSNNASAFLSFFAISLIFLLIICSISTAYFSVPVWASNPIQCLIWELITTLIVASGSAPVNNLVNQSGMASDLGSHYVSELASGEYSVAQCDAAIQSLLSSSSSASQAAGNIANSFATTAADAAQAAEALSAAGVEGVQAAEGAMSAGENLANCAAASVGAGSIVGMLGMEFTGAAALGAGAVAVVAGVGLGILGYNIVSHFAESIKNNASIIQPTDSFSHYPSNYNWKYTRYNYNNTYRYYWGWEDGFLPVVYEESGSPVYQFINITNGRLNRFDMSQRISTGKYNSPNITSINSGQSGIYFSQTDINNSNFSNTTWYRLSDNSTTRNKEIQDLINGTTVVNIDNSKTDIVNPNGNYTYNPVTNNYNYNYTTNPTYNTNNQTLQPIYNTDYQQFIDNTNYNTTNNIDNSQTFQDFISNYLTEYTAPAPDTDPDIPEQPVKPTVTPNTSEQIEQNKEMMLPVDLKDYFPFCIPFDIYALMTHFEDIDREAPEIDIDLDLGAAGEYTINVDLSDYDDAASILRALELIAFIIGLMVAARKLIGD